MNKPRSIADVVRGFGEEQLADLVRLRPDLAVPRPADLDELIERAIGASSTQLVLDGLDAWQRRVALALAACPDAVSTRHLAALMGAERAHVDKAVRALERRALLWGSERSWHLTRAARSSFGSYPAGLAGASSAPMTDAQIDAALAQLDEAAHAVLERLLWDNPTGRVAQADRRGSADSERPVDGLLHHRLVRPLDSDTVVLPREVALKLRGGRLFREQVSPVVPSWPAGEESAVVDQAGLGSALELVGSVEVLVERIGRLQPRPLATGALPKRDLTALSREAGGVERTLALLMVAQRAGLIATGGSTAWLPTNHYDQWLEGDGWARWSLLRDAWLAMDAMPDPDAPALAPGNQVAWAGALRRLAVDQLLAAAPGAPVEPEVLAARLGWLRPAWARLDLVRLCTELVREFGWFGLVALGRRTALVEADADPGFPQPTDRFMVQSDLTAISPGPLLPDVARGLALLAEREPGRSGVHRFSPDSIRRGLDAGWTADEIRAWAAEHSLTPVPQALDYLVDDVARRHGQVQVSAVGSVVTVDDPVIVDTVLAHPDATVLGLRRLATTVLAAAAEPGELVSFLRQIGLAPVAQDATGTRFTTPLPRRARAGVAPFEPRTQRVEAERFVADLLARDEGRRHALASGNLLMTLEESIGRPGWWQLDYVGNDGAPQSSTVRVLALSGGTARLMKKAEGPFTLPVSRMVGLRPA